jgi:NADPH-dependent ferric siderophore reductase
MHLAQATVSRAERISPNFVRVTLDGPELATLPQHGHDHWFRMFLPREEGETDFSVPDRMDMRGYLAYLRIPGERRPHMRNYTVREHRPADGQIDVDFVVHGDEGVATRWATRATPGDRVALLDQGRGYDYPDDTEAHLLVGDETALPAIAGILRDLPRDARGAAYLELIHPDDAQELDAPDGVEVHWLVREPGARPGSLAIETVQAAPLPEGRLAAYLVGEQQLPTTLRRWLVSQGVPKSAIEFTGYWRIGPTRSI